MGRWLVEFVRRTRGGRLGTPFIVASLLILGCPSKGSHRDSLPVLMPPSGLVAISGDIQVTLDWTPVPDATSYNVYWSTSPGVTKITGNKEAVPSPPHAHTGLSNGTTYYYVVTSLVQGRQSGDSSEVSATPAEIIGTLDSSFAGTGWVVHHNAAGGDDHDWGWDLAVDSQGRPVVTGASLNASRLPEMVIWRYTPGGILDTSFNGQGWITRTGSAGGVSDQGKAITVDPLDRILVAGAGGGTGSDFDMIVWRYETDGTPDTTFNGVGWAAHHDAAGSAGNDWGLGITLDASGRILVTGHSEGSLGWEDMVVWRFLPDGQLDSAFGGQGWVVHADAAGGLWTDQGNAITVDRSGRIIVAGESRGMSTDFDMVVWRFEPNGMLDGSFNGQGWFVHHGAAGGDGEDRALAVDVDFGGKIVLAGSSENASPDTDMVVWRLNEDGTLDSSFGGQGWVVEDSAGAPTGGQFASDLRTDGSGRIIVAGGSLGEMTVWRYLTDGTLDAVFNAQGWLRELAGTPGWGSGFAMTVNSAGRILVVGDAMNTAGNLDMALWQIR